MSNNREHHNNSLDKFNLEFEDMNQPSNPLKSKKVLTNIKESNIIEDVKKLKRKDNKMANDKNQKNVRNVLTSIAWLVEAGIRAFTGWVLLSNFDYLVTTIAAVYLLATAGLIVITHFVKAHK